MTPRQPFSDQESVFSEDGANFGGPYSDVMSLLHPGDERDLHVLSPLIVRGFLLILEPPRHEVREETKKNLCAFRVLRGSKRKLWKSVKHSM